MKRIIIEEAASPVNEKSAYLILCFVIVVAIIAIIGVLCVVKRCKSKDMRLEAENVDQHVKGVRCCQGDDMDNVVQSEPTDQQYRPNARGVNLAAVASSRPQGETTSQGTAPDTARELLSDREVAPIDINELNELNELEDAVQRRDIVQRPRTADELK